MAVSIYIAAQNLTAARELFEEAYLQLQDGLNGQEFIQVDGGCATVYGPNESE